MSIVTLNQGLFIIPSTDQYMSLGCTFMLSSIDRTKMSLAFFNSSFGKFNDQKHQQKHESLQLMSMRPPKRSVSKLRYLSSGYSMFANLHDLPLSNVISTLV